MTGGAYIGIGAVDLRHTDRVVPVQTFCPEPGTQYYISPRLTLYVMLELVSGDALQPGQLLDVHQYGKVVKIDFDGCNVPEAALIVDKEGKWQDDGGQTKQNSVTWNELEDSR